MSDQLPEMIPMPGNPSDGGGGPPPESFERQLSPEEERNTLINFMGNMYGEAKKMDGQITGPSSTLQRGKSEEIKKQIELAYTQPQQSAPPVQTAPLPQPEVQTQPQPQVEVTQPVDNDQLSFNFDISEKEELFTLVERILTRLDRLQRKVDSIVEYNENSKIVSLPVKRQSKKKSVDKKEEV